VSEPDDVVRAKGKGGQRRCFSLRFLDEGGELS